MAQSRTKNITRNIIVGFLYRFVHILMPFVTRSVIINVLGKEYLGLNTLFTSIFTFLNLAEFGFASALTYKMYEPAQKEDYETLSVYVVVIRRVYKIIGLVILGLGIIILPFLNNFISGECPSDVNIYVLYCIYLVNTVIPYLGSGYCTSIFSAFQRIDISNTINAVLTLGLNIVQVIIVLTTRRYYPYVLCLPVFTCLNNLMLYRTRKKKFANIKVDGKLDNKVLRETYSSAGALFGHSLNYVIVTSADNIVISSFLGLSVLAMYGNYYTIFSAVLGLIDIVIQSCLPSVGNLLLENNYEHEIKVFRSISFLSYWLSGWCAICLLCLYQPFMKIWMGKDLILPFSTVILFAIYMYAYKFRSAILLFKDAAGMWKADFWKPYVSALANIVINILLVKIIGLNGVLISTILVFLFINFPWESSILLKARYKMIKRQYYVNCLWTTALVIVEAVVTYLVCTNIVILNAYIELCVKAGVCVIIPNIMWILCYYRTDEYKYFKTKVMGLIKRQGA